MMKVCIFKEILHCYPAHSLGCYTVICEMVWCNCLFGERYGCDTLIVVHRLIDVFEIYYANLIWRPLPFQLLQTLVTLALMWVTSALVLVA